MEYYKITSIALLLSALWSCQSPQKTGDTTEHVTGRDTVGSHFSDAENVIEHQLIKKQGERDTVAFELDEPSWVTITLTVPGDSGNIRINQLLMPDGETDGPFGKTFADSLSATGTYSVIVAESLMQEDPYTGTYVLKIERQ